MARAARRPGAVLTSRMSSGSGDPPAPAVQTAGWRTPRASESQTRDLRLVGRLLGRGSSSKGLLGIFPTSPKSTSARNKDVSSRASSASCEDRTKLHQLSELKRVLMKHAQDVEKLRPAEERKLDEVVNELCSTEANYLGDLSFTEEQFSLPLKEKLGHQEFLLIFSNLSQLQDLHQKLGLDLEKVSSLAPAARARAVVDEYLKMMPFFKMYGAYCANFPNVAAALTAARDDPAVDDLLTERETEHHTTLLALLFRPVQRMCVYPLLFKQVRRGRPDPPRPAAHLTVPLARRRSA